MNKLITVVLLMAFSLSVSAGTFYVRTDGNNAASGLNNTNNATTGAWLTVDYAVAHVSSGDIIHVVAGTYTTTSSLTLPVGVSMEGDGITSIIKSTITAAFTPMFSAISVAGTDGNQSISNLKFDGQANATKFAFDFKGRSNVSINNCTFVDFDYCAVILTGQVDNNPGAPSIYATGCSVYNCIFTDCGKCDGTTMYADLMWGGTNGMQIYSNTFTNNGKASQTNGESIKGWCESHVYNTSIHDNTFTTQPTPASKTNGEDGHWDFAVELFESYGNNVFYNNTSTGSLDLNWQFNYFGTYSWWIYSNTFGFSTFQVGRQTGILLEFDTERCIIENNTFRNVADGIIFSMRTGGRIRGCTIQKNLFYNNGSANGDNYGFCIGNFGGTTYTCDTLNIYNNTMVAHATASFAPFYGVEFDDATTFNHFNFKNNIISGYQDGALVTNMGAWLNSFVQYTCSYNNPYSNALFTSFGGLNQPTGVTVSNNLIGTNPTFVGGSDYRLQAGSPLIDAGVNVGLPYNGTAPDVGYWEFGNPNILINVKRKLNYLNY